MQFYIVPLIGNLLMLGCAVFAYRQCSAAERFASLWLGGNVVLSMVLFLLGLDSPTALLIADGIFALGLLPLAMIFVSYWIGLVTFIAAALFGLEAVYLLNDWPIDPTYAWINNCLWLSVPLVFLTAGMTSLIRKRREARGIADAVAAQAAGC